MVRDMKSVHGGYHGMMSITNKIYMVVIEPTLSPHMEGEKGWIIDDDLCIIEL